MRLSDAVRILSEAKIESARLDARLLFSHFGGFSHAELVGCDPECEDERLADALRRRAKREPLQYIVGEVAFFNETYRVTPSCLIPRAETELLVELAIKRLPRGAHFLDLCTGSGCIAISTVKNSDTRGTALDLSDEALDVARKNAEANGVSERISFIHGDALKRCVEGDFFAVLSNPPYVTEKEYEALEPEIYFEPRMALVGGGEDGASFYDRITELYIDRVAEKGGFVAFEIGSGQADALRRIAEKYGAECEIINDYSALARIAVLKK